MPRQPTGYLHEHTANTIIAQWLNAAGRSWHANGDRVRTIAGSSERPDIVVTEGGRMPAIIECEYTDRPRPAVADAEKRLGKTLAGETRPFTEVIAVGIDAVCKGDGDAAFRRRLENNEPIFTVQLVSEDGGGVKIWPDNPLPATPNDLIAYCEYAQVPQAVIDRESADIALKVAAAGKRLLDDISATAYAGRPTLAALRRLTGCRHDHEKTPNAVPPVEYPDYLAPRGDNQCPHHCGHDEQAARTACAIWLIAIDLQNDLARHSSSLRDRNLQTTEAMAKAALLGRLTSRDILLQWRIIAAVNYLPVIELAIATLTAGIMGDAISDILHYLDGLSSQLNTLHARHIYNFAGELWQRIVPDREERAAHYTRPEIAELLATLAATRFDGRNVQQLAGLNLMDAACGTGTLLGAGERAIRRRYAAKGGRNPQLHQERMENHIYAMDVNGIAGALTAKRLTDLNVEQEYAGSKIAVITDPAGSLILLDPNITGVSRVLGYRNATPTPGIGGDVGYFHVMLGGIDWALMNPPYNRPRRGRQQATRGLEQPRAAAKRHHYLMSNGQAGLASDFGNLSNIRLAPGGVYSHVLPLTAAHSSSWKNWRAELEKDFQDIVVIANVSGRELQSMSADTGMSEMLVVAAKRGKRPKQWQPTEILCVNLHSAPATLAEGYAMAQEIAAIPEGSPRGLLSRGNYTRFQHDGAGFPWGAVGSSNNELTLVMTALLDGKAFDPITLTTHELALPIAALGDITGAGPTHHSIGHPRGAADPIGAFEWRPLPELWNAPAQQSMWAANAKEQTSILTNPTHGGQVVRFDLAQQMVAYRSSFHLNRNISWTSQALSVAHTRTAVHGGSAWNALQGQNVSANRAAALFLNSAWGCLILNAYAKSGQRGPRARLQVKGIPGLPCPAFHLDTPAAQRARDVADHHFDELARLELQPFAYCFQDANRHRIDDAVAEMLGLDPKAAAVQDMLAYWRILFVGEPNVNGRQRKIVAALAQYRERNG